MQVIASQILSGNNHVLTIQQFDIHPITIAVSYINTSGNRRSSGAGDVSSKSATIGIRSFSAADLNITPACLRYILLQHYGHFIRSALSDFHGVKYTDIPLVLLSRFQCSSLLSEFYQIKDSTIAMTKNIAMLELPRIDVFPVASGRVEMSIDYKQTFIQFLQQEVTAVEQQRLGKRRQPQRTFPYRVVNLTTDELTIEAMTRKLLRATNDVDDTILFIEYCGLRRSIICFTSKYTFLYTLRDKKLLARFRIDLIEKVELKGKRVEFEVAKPSKWRKNTVPILVDFETEEIAEEAHLLVTTLIAVSHSEF